MQGTWLAGPSAVFEKLFLLKALPCRSFLGADAISSAFLSSPFQTQLQPVRLALNQKTERRIEDTIFNLERSLFIMRYSSYIIFIEYVLESRTYVILNSRLVPHEPLSLVSLAPPVR